MLTWRGSLNIELDKLRFADWFHRDISDNFLSLCSKFDDLSKEDALKNNELAFKVAEEKLKVPALLEASDLVSMEEIDEMSVMTYLSMLYKRIKKNSSPAPRTPAVNSTTVPTRRTLFDVLKDENNFTERFEKRKHRLSSGEKDNFSNRSVPKETTLRELHQENHV